MTDQTRTYDVTVEAEVTVIVTVSADSENEAEELARDCWAQQICSSDVDVDVIKIEECSDDDDEHDDDDQ